MQEKKRLWGKIDDDAVIGVKLNTKNEIVFAFVDKNHNGTKFAPTPEGAKKAETFIKKAKQSVSSYAFYCPDKTNKDNVLQWRLAYGKPQLLFAPEVKEKAKKAVQWL